MPWPRSVPDLPRGYEVPAAATFAAAAVAVIVLLPSWLAALSVAITGWLLWTAVARVRFWRAERQLGRAMLDFVQCVLSMRQAPAWVYRNDPAATTFVYVRTRPTWWIGVNQHTVYQLNDQTATARDVMRFEDLLLTATVYRFAGRSPVWSGTMAGRLPAHPSDGRWAEPPMSFTTYATEPELVVVTALLRGSTPQRSN
ncbi:hypothetical protein [Paractinoplanes rishiriensis]|uniref:Uncharacterized protein n=1 Tax=Paractinoplanes rishiriensis TaxID=1050105 RepID=A0A919K648_9ACTN|nr:hypothetical protein [Actinoplanes rishiriensis]GIF01596.1 hypothetical protein Ari01nite_90600 [Actinoplanes rishiriensis]